MTVRMSGEEPAPQAPPPYKPLRFEEDYRYLRDRALRTDFWDPIKYILLKGDGGHFLSLGGEARERYEFFKHFAWGAGPEDRDGHLLQRHLLHADLHLGEQLRLFGQLQSSLEHGRKGGPRPTDEDQLDVHQAFAELKPRFGEAAARMLRVGRQEMSFGSSRLV
ncbi:MAG: alginate export family protein, partial [Candidatus Methylomirabilales bacterium]